jgi:hypothetical protein
MNHADGFGAVCRTVKIRHPRASKTVGRHWERTITCFSQFRGESFGKVQRSIAVFLAQTEGRPLWSPQGGHEPPSTAPTRFLRPTSRGLVGAPSNPLLSADA